MPLLLRRLVTPVIEITHVHDPLPFSVMVPPDRVELLRVYREPQLLNHGSEKHFACTHENAPAAYFSSCDYDLLTVMEDPIEANYLSERLALRYQLNPHHAHTLQPRGGRGVVVYESSFLREVFVEAVTTTLDPSAGDEVSLSGAVHNVCGVNVYTRAEGVFSPPGASIPVGGFVDSDDGGDLMLVYSTMPGVKKTLHRAFDASANSPSLIVDDVFVRWRSLGWLSLNELHDMGALHAERVADGVFDFVVQ